MVLCVWVCLCGYLSGYFGSSLSYFYVCVFSTCTYSIPTICLYTTPHHSYSYPYLYHEQALGQKGELQLKKGKRIGGNLFVCMLYETGEEVTVQCYHQLTSTIFYSSISASVMINWITEEHKKACKTEVDKYKTPILLRPENKKMRHQWLIDHIIVDSRHQTFKVIY